MTVESCLRSVAAALLVATSACATAAPADSGRDPAPVMQSGELVACSYERIGPVEVRTRSGMMTPTNQEMHLALGRRARNLGADAVIEVKVAALKTIRGRTVSTAGERNVVDKLATGVAIRFTSPGCPGE